MSLGVYISVPFCRTKCSYCNFASDVFSKSAYENYVSRLVEDIAGVPKTASECEYALDRPIDSIYLGGGTPSILSNSQLLRIFKAVHEQFAVNSDAEVTVECAPGTLTPGLIDTLAQCGVNRVSLGVQSFVDKEAHAVGRLHNRTIILDEVARLRSAGLTNLNIDLIAGLPHQTADTWTFSLAETIALAPPHVSVYMLEVDDDSRLGRELIAGGTRYHAHFVPDDGATADFYQQACETLNAAGIAQYEISNFARPSSQSRHNLKYWTRQPYIGFGVDAHSMLCVCDTSCNSAYSSGASPARILLGDQCPKGIRFSTPDSLDAYMNHAPHTVTPVSLRSAIEESFFLGLRLNSGVDLDRLSAEYTPHVIAAYEPTVNEGLREGLLERHGSLIRLTARGRLLSNELFQRFLADHQDAESSLLAPHRKQNVSPRRQLR